MSSLKIFIKFLQNIRSTGAFYPSGDSLSKSIAEVILSRRIDQPIIELGAGTGSITKFLPVDTIIVEKNEYFHSLLIKKFPDYNIIKGDAMDVIMKINKPTWVVSSIPIIGNKSSEMFQYCLDLMREKGLILGISTYSYGFQPPLRNCNFKYYNKIKIIWKNIPPAIIWHYYEN